MYRAILMTTALLFVACGGEPLEKTGESDGTNAAANGVVFPPGNNTQANGEPGNASTNNLNPGFQNPCETGPLTEPIPNCAPELMPSTGDPEADCVRRINQFRWECQCLPPLERWTEGEACADEQAEYDALNFSAHAGFSERICQPRGSAQNECPDWNSWDQVLDQCLQMMWDEGPGENFQAHGHYLNMSNTGFTRVACGSGSNWYVQNFE